MIADIDPPTVGAQAAGNRKTNADLIRHGVMEIQVARFTLSDGGSAVLARLI